VATSRVLFQNYLVELSPTVTFAGSGGAVANAPAIISNAQAIKQGYATGTPSGIYTGIVDKLYRVEIHVGGTGAFGSAQWRWTDDASGNYDDIVWMASNLTTQNNITVALNNGVTWRHNQVGTNTPQFVVGDYWLFQVSLKYGYQKSLDGTRDHEYRSGTMPASAVLEQRYDLGTSVSATGFVMMDHNVPSNTTTQVIATAANFTTVVHSTTVIWAAGKMLAIISGAPSRFWVIRVTTTGTAPALGYLRWSELFLGSSLVFNKTFNIGFQDSSEWLGAVNVDTLRRGPGPRQIEGRMIRLTYGHMDTVDQARLQTLRTWINDPTYNVQRAFYFLLIDSDLTNFILGHWVNAYVKEHEFLERYSGPIELVEVIRSVA
jgi:hypothetical protein